MRFVTWNINGLKARLPFVLRWLEARQPDVVGLQELKMVDEAFPHEVFEEQGYSAISHGQKAWNGVAVLARTKPSLVAAGLPNQAHFGARLLTARIGEVTFTTVYCPNGKDVTHADFEAKLAWFDDLHTYLHDLTTSGTHVVCGDFNIAPTALDSWSEKRFAGSIFHTASERKRFQALLDLGLDDVFRAQHPSDPGFSWWDYRGGAFHRGWGLRIDMLLLSGALTPSVEAVWVDRDWRKKLDELTPSDHAPVVVDVAVD